MTDSRYDLLLCGGTLIDGTGTPPRPADIGVQADRIVAVGLLDRDQARQIEDITGCFVTPGFVDIHAHSEVSLLVDPRAGSKVRQGVTSEISGQCGLSAAPLLGQARDEFRVWAARWDLEPCWNSLAEFLELVEDRGIALNFGTLVGHGNLRSAVIGGEARPPTADELGVMSGMLADSLQEGALGLSSGLFYAPGSYAGSTELEALGAVVAAHGGLYATHIRNEGRSLEKSLGEAMQIARASSVTVQISHLKLASRGHWGGAGRMLDLLDAAVAKDLDLGWDQYPYTAAATTLDAAVPPQFHAGGKDALLQRLQTPHERARIADAISTDIESDWENLTVESGWDNIVLSFHPTDPSLAGRSISSIAEGRGVDPLQTALDLILESGARAMIVDFCMDGRDVKAILHHACTIVASDAEALAADGPLSVGAPHPRA